MNIITGYGGQPHIYPHHDRETNISIFGEGTHILDVGSNMAATVISSNQVDIEDGLMVAEGCTAEVARGTTESMTIDNGSQGMLRTDLIVARYTKTAGTAVEAMQLVVIKGTQAASNPATPTYNTGTIADGDSPVDFPLYAVHLDGISITSVERLVDVVSIKGDMDSVKSRVTTLETKVPQHITRQYEFSGIGIQQPNGAFSRTRSIAVEGYTPSGIKGWRILNDYTNGKNAAWCVLSKIWIDGDNLDYTIWNQHTSQGANVRLQLVLDYISNNAT